MGRRVAASLETVELENERVTTASIAFTVRSMASLHKHQLDRGKRRIETTDKHAPVRSWQAKSSRQPSQIRITLVDPDLFDTEKKKSVKGRPTPHHPFPLHLATMQDPVHESGCVLKGLLESPTADAQAAVVREYVTDDAVLGHPLCTVKSARHSRGMVLLPYLPICQDGPSIRT